MVNLRYPSALPRFRLEPVPPVQVPAERSLGAVTGIQVGADGHIWVLHMARVLEWGVRMVEPHDPASRLPPVVEFDPAGRLVSAWGGPDWLEPVDGQPQWPRLEENLTLDDEGAIWVFGGDLGYDHAVQRFSRDGKLLLRLGRFGQTGGDESRTLLGCPTDCWHDVARREVYVADGYVNHRVAVFDSDTGAFKRCFGAYGSRPPFSGVGPASFTTPVHAIIRGPDGLLYVCDRLSSRLQAFDISHPGEARFVRELELKVDSPHGSTFNLAFTPDGRFALVNDGANSRIWTLDLAKWAIVDSFPVDDALPRADSGPDLSATVHKVTTDRAGNLLLARSARGVQRLRYEGAP